MQIRELSIPDAYEIVPRQHRDERGVFLEWYRFDELEKATGRSIDLRQANTSVSRRGVVRGIHFADVPRGQAKYVTVPHGAVIDFIVDIRVGSPTYGHWDSVLLDSNEQHAVFLSEGLGHAFVALTDHAVVSYLVTDVYSPASEHAINPLDPDLALKFPMDEAQLLLSPKDLQAPSLQAAAQSGLLPSWVDTRDFYATVGSQNAVK